MSMQRKETVIQFGEGGFLRGFVDYFFQKLKEKELFDGSVVVVQPIEKGMIGELNKQNCCLLYTSFPIYQMMRYLTSRR